MNTLYRFFRSTIGALLFVIIVIPAAAGDLLRVTTLNAGLLFRPGNDVGGQLADGGPPDIESYNAKLENLGRMCAPSDVIALQEIGSAVEVGDFAKVVKGTPVFVQGRDTYTGQDVGFVHYLRPGFKAVHHGRVPMLDREISKHLLLVIDAPGHRFNILNVHLLRAIRDSERNQRQRDLIVTWLEAARRKEPASIFVIAGDLNINAPTAVLPLGHHVLELMDWPVTHSSNLRLDHLILVGRGRWESYAVLQPPYGPRPNRLNRMLWSDHFAVTGCIVTD